MRIGSQRMVVGGVTGPGVVEIDGPVFAAVVPGAGDRVDVDLGGLWLVPGFVDIHVHGGGVTSFDGGPDAARAAAAHHHRAGTTTVCASLVSAPLDDLIEVARDLEPLVADGTVAGVHLEGPWIAEARCGAHDPGHLRPPAGSEVARVLDACGPVLRMVTLAPELPGALDAIWRIVAAGAVAAIGHTEAGWDQTRTAIDAGASVATHLFNGMPPLRHRSPGAALACIASPGVVCELIADGVHVHPAVLAWAADVAAGGAAFVTDAVGLGPADLGPASLGGRPVEARDGAVWLAGTTTLAGSTLTQAGALRNAVAAGVPMVAALDAVTVAPARALGLPAGAIAPGRRADLVVLGDDLVVAGVLRAGRWLVEPG